MVQELYAIENLSRVDTLCLDKTGTLTTQHFLFKNLVKLNDFDENKLLSSFMSAMKETNETGKAIIEKYGSKEILKVKECKLFCSETKYSEVTFIDGITYRLGAPEFLLKKKSNLELSEKHQKEGYRVLAFVSSEQDLGLILLEDELRKGIKDKNRHNKRIIGEIFFKSCFKAKYLPVVYYKEEHQEKRSYDISKLQKGGVPATPSGTATLLRLSPSHRFCPRPILAVSDFRHPQLPWLDGRCVQGPGTYSPRHG